MASTNRELHSKMRAKDDEGMAPFQSLAFVDPDLIPREVDRLYPAEFERNRDAEKEGKMQLKYQLPAEFGQKFLEKDDVDYIYEKGKEQEMFQFDAWYASLFDHSDPAQLELSRKINPSWFDRRMRAVDKSLEMQRKIAKIKLFGIQDKEDVMTTYAISTGRINPSLYMTDFMRPAPPDRVAVNEQYRRGTFAPRTADSFLQPVPQPVGPAMPLTYTGASAHTGFGVPRNVLQSMMTGATAPPAPGMPGMMPAANADWFYTPNADGVPNGVMSTRFVRNNGPDADRPFGGFMGFPYYQQGDYKRNYSMTGAQQQQRQAARVAAAAQPAPANPPPPPVLGP